MSRFRLIKLRFTSVKRWLARLQTEIEQSSLGALSLFIGLFSICLGVFTIWTQLESWLVTNWIIEVIVAILLAGLIMRVFRSFAHKIRREPLEEHAENVLSYLKHLLDNGRAMQQDKVVESLVEHKNMKRVLVIQVLEMLIESGRVKEKADGTVTLMNIEDENK